MVFYIIPSPLPERKSLKTSWQERVARLVTGLLALFSRVPCINIRKHTCASGTCRSTGTFLQKQAKCTESVGCLSIILTLGKKPFIILHCCGYSRYLVSGTVTLWHTASLLETPLEESMGTKRWSHHLLALMSWNVLASHICMTMGTRTAEQTDAQLAYRMTQPFICSHSKTEGIPSCFIPIILPCKSYTVSKFTVAYLRQLPCQIPAGVTHHTKPHPPLHCWLFAICLAFALQLPSSRPQLLKSADQCLEQGGITVCSRDPVNSVGCWIHNAWVCVAFNLSVTCTNTALLTHACCSEINTKIFSNLFSFVRLNEWKMLASAFIYTAHFKKTCRSDCLYTKRHEKHKSRQSGRLFFFSTEYLFIFYTELWLCNFFHCCVFNAS